mmetsp:Transcript_43831/g.93209  ORF Transcript_43831/g.93209 Transcript_43831/m.93209 type:complete len:235 (-) Transcript_43831:69-773(-)
MPLRARVLPPGHGRPRDPRSQPPPIPIRVRPPRGVLLPPPRGPGEAGAQHPRLDQQISELRAQGRPREGEGRVLPPGSGVAEAERNESREMRRGRVVRRPTLPGRLRPVGTGGTDAPRAESRVALPPRCGRVRQRGRQGRLREGDGGGPVRLRPRARAAGSEVQGLRVPGSDGVLRRAERGIPGRAGRGGRAQQVVPLQQVAAEGARPEGVRHAVSHLGGRGRRFEGGPIAWTG